MRHFGEIDFFRKSEMAYYSACFHQKITHKQLQNQREQKSYVHIDFYRFVKKVVCAHTTFLEFGSPVK